MKRFITLFLTIIVAISMTLISSATTSNGRTIEIDGFSVIFEADSAFTAEEQQLIAEKVVLNNTEDATATTYNLLCTLFGHKTTTESFTVIEHCVREAQPRCIKSFQDVTACSRCDYVTIDVVSSTYIHCCE